jgi:hypothetical protein
MNKNNSRNDNNSYNRNNNNNNDIRNNRNNNNNKRMTYGSIVVENMTGRQTWRGLQDVLHSY